MTDPGSGLEDLTILQGTSSIKKKVRAATRITSYNVCYTKLLRSATEWLEVIGRLDRETLDALSVSTYDFRQPAFETDLTMAALTRQATQLPLLICGRIFDRASAEAALENADIALSAKSILLNPDWVADVRAGRTLPVHRAEEANIAYTPEPLP